MRYLALIFGLVLATVSSSHGQILEKSVADTACVCMSQIDKERPLNHIKSSYQDCMKSAISKNAHFAQAELDPGKKKNYSEGRDRGKELGAKVHRRLMEDCDSYKRIFTLLNPTKNKKHE